MRAEASGLRLQTAWLPVGEAVVVPELAAVDVLPEEVPVTGGL
jgi:hypothetical protein